MQVVTIRTFWIFILLSFSAGPVLAQSFPTGDSLLPGNKHYFHEIGINVTPVITQLISVYPIRRFEVIYKRQHTGHAFRVGILYSKTNSNHTFTTDSSLHANFYESQLMLAKAGYERHIDINQKIILFYGADIEVGFESRLRNFEEFESDIPVPDSSDFVRNSYQSDQVVAALTPILGIKVPVSQRISFTAQTGFQFIFGTGSTVHTRRKGQFNGSNPEVLVSEPYPTATFSFNAAPIINNVSMNLHF